MPCVGVPRVKQQSSEAQRRSPEGERQSPSSEDEREEKESSAEIRNADDYKEIFQPKSAICRQLFFFFSVHTEHCWLILGSATRVFSV